MTDDELKECEYINYEMRFYSYNDFCRHHKIIKYLYNNMLSKNGRIFFKWYLYANVHLTTTQKNRAWDYINDYAEEHTLLELEEVEEI